MGVECAMTYSDPWLKNILTRAKTIAVVGVSMNPVRPSYFVARYLGLRGYRVIPVNPMHAGEKLFGQTVVASLNEISAGVDMVDIFRRSDAVPEIVDTALAAFPDLQTIWMQIGVEHAKATAVAQARGVDVVQNRCPKIEYQRLFGELRQGGFATGVISSKL
jgi:predicted CoA-binding protein